MKANIGRVLWLWGPPVLALGLIFYFSSQSRLPDYLDVFTGQFGTKPLHTGGYFTLALTLLRAFHGGSSRLRWRPVLYTLATVSLISMVDEAHQAPIPGRHAEVRDVAIDLLGFLIALGGTIFYFRLSRNNRILLN